MRRAAIRLETVIVRSGRVGAHESDQEVFMINERRGRYYGLGGVGSQIWRMLAEPVVVADLCAALATDFDISEPVLETQVLQFLGHLAQEGLVEVVGAANLPTR